MRPMLIIPRQPDADLCTLRSRGQILREDLSEIISYWVRTIEMPKASDADKEHFPSVLANHPEVARTSAPTFPLRLFLGQLVRMTPETRGQSYSEDAHQQEVACTLFDPVAWRYG